MIAKYRKAEFPGEWWLTDFTMGQVEGQLNQLRARNAELEAEVVRLRKALENDLEIYREIQSSHKASIGSLHSHYTPQLRISSITGAVAIVHAALEASDG